MSTGRNRKTVYGTVDRARLEELQASFDTTRLLEAVDLIDGQSCCKPVLWFDYAIGERSHMRGFVCDGHRVSNRVEKLAAKEQDQATHANPWQ